MADTTTPVAPTPVETPKKVNPIVSFLQGLWSKVEALDNSINSFVNKLTNGQAAITLAIAAVIYWLVRPYVGWVLTIPATVIKLVLEALTVVVPFVINGIPYAIAIVLGLLAIVEVKNYLLKLIKIK